MAVTPDQARAITKLHTAWCREQVAEGVDGPVPPGRKAGSDYNQHVPDLEASGADMDAYHDRVREILGLPPL
jgi:hypothetical protein